MSGQRTRALIALLLVVAVALLAVGARHDARRVAGAERLRITAPVVLTTDTPSIGATVAQGELDAVLDWLDCCGAAWNRAVAEYLAWQHEQDVAAWAAAHQPPPTRRAAPAVVAGSGDCGPVAEVVGWGVVMRESTGNPYVVNSSDHRGCAQISGGWWGGACSGLDWTNVNDQASCARIVLELQGPSAWAQTWG